MNLVNKMKCENVDVLEFMKGDIDIDTFWPTTLDLLDANPVHDNTEDDGDENYVDVLDLLEEQWLMKGIKPQRNSIMDAFSNKDTFNNWVRENYSSVSKFVEILNDEIRIRSVEAIQESIIGIKNMSVYPSTVYGERYKILEKGKQALRAALDNHDEMVQIYFDNHLTKVLGWVEDVLEVRAFLLGYNYERFTLTNQLGVIFKSALTTLVGNVSNETPYSNAHEFDFYANSDDEWEYWCSDAVGDFVKEIVALIPFTNYEWSLNYYGKYINGEWMKQQAEVVMNEYNKVFESIL